MNTYHSQQGEWEEPVIVTINGKEHPTQLYNGVQRFIPNSLNEWFSNWGIAHHSREASLLNDMVLAVHRGEIEIADWIEFNLSDGLSVEGACSSISQQLSNMDLEGQYPFVVHNPIWGDEAEDWNAVQEDDE